MTSLYPGALWRPMPGQEKRAKRRKGRGVGFHIAVSERASIYEINLGTGNDAHLYVRRDGGVEQNIDLDLVAYAGAGGNGSMIWVETQGGTTPADVKTGRWTPQQAETLAQIAAWANRTEGVPLQVMPDSRPASRGIGTHRLGIKPWRVTDGESWSSANGKECPGDARVAQVPEIVTRAQQIASGQTATPNKEDEMDAPQAASLHNAEENSWAARLDSAAAKDEARAANGKLAEIKGILAALAAGGDLTAEQIHAAAEAGAREGARAVLAAAVNDLTTAVDAALRADNADAADKAVAIIRDRLTSPAA